MLSFLERTVSALRVRLGWDEPSTGEYGGLMTPRHGWLLPAPMSLLGLQVAVAPSGPRAPVDRPRSR